MLTMSGFGRTFDVPKRLQNGTAFPSGKATAWELATAPVLSGELAAWASQVVDSALTAAGSSGASAINAECTECKDTGFYGEPDVADPDLLRALVRRTSAGYESLTADGTWTGYEPDLYALELLDEDLAADLACAITAGAAGLMRRYCMPLAFLPPADVIVAAPAPLEGQSADWINYAIVDELDTGAVLQLIRLRQGPELERYDKAGTWVADTELLSRLQGIAPPPLVELPEDQLPGVLQQIDSTQAADGQPQDSVPEEDSVAASGPSSKERAKAADDGDALPDGSFPIRNTAELEKAIHALGRANDVDRARRHIIKRARALNAVGKLPDDWGITSSASCTCLIPPVLLNATASAALDAKGSGRSLVRDEVARVAAAPGASSNSTTVNVHLLGDGLQVTPVAAGSETAAALSNMIEHQSFGYRANHDFVNSPMNNLVPTVNTNQSVATFSSTSGPNKALSSNLRTAQDALKQRNLSRQGSGDSSGLVAGVTETLGVDRFLSTAVTNTLSGEGAVEAGTLPAPGANTLSLCQASAVRACEIHDSLLADASTHHSVKPGAVKLRQYWSTGKGAAKIRWNTPGDWTRCYRFLRKYMGLRAKGYCSQLHRDTTGKWPGSKLNASGAQMVMNVSPEESLVAALRAGTWAAENGHAMSDLVDDLKDGIYEDATGLAYPVVRSLVAGAFPVVPPAEWFDDPKLRTLTPLTVEESGRVYGHMADWNMPHIGLPGNRRPPRSSSGYRYFQNKAVRALAADGSIKIVPTGPLTLVGGHAPMSASVDKVVAHYDETRSGIADVHVGEDSYGIWFAGSLRPDVTPERLRVFMASALSGDWRVINGGLEMVACCSVNTPGFPIARALAAGGAVMALVAAGARSIAVKAASMLADAAVLERLDNVENALYTRPLEVEPGAVEYTDLPVLEVEPAAVVERLAEVEPEPVAEVPESILRAREASAARRQALRDRVHKTPVTAAFKYEDWMHPELGQGGFAETGKSIAIQSADDESVAIAKILDVTSRGVKVKFKVGGKTTTLKPEDLSRCRVVADSADKSKAAGDAPAAGTDPVPPEAVDPKALALS